MICILGVGMFLSIRTGFLQIRKFPYAIRTTIGRMFRKKDASDGSMTPFQAVCTALAATVGTGNIAGVAGAIAIGGPGAIFWMWCSAAFGMCTKFAEVTLAVHFRERNKEGDLVGGPMYYIKKRFGAQMGLVGRTVCAFGMVAAFGVGNSTQISTAVASINEALVRGVDPFVLWKSGHGIDAGAIVALVILGGAKRIGAVAEYLIPVMSLGYIALSLGALFQNAEPSPAR